MVTIEMPAKPSNEDFAAVQTWLASRNYMSSMVERQARHVLRYLLALRDAQPASVAVPREVAEWAERIDERIDAGTARLHVAPWILSLVPRPVVEWRKGVNAQDNTAWSLFVGGVWTCTIAPQFLGDEIRWGTLGDEVGTFLPDLAAAKARAEELCGVSTKKGG